MVHVMHLYDNYFQKVKYSKKKYEIRLFDEKRKKIKTGDTIIFINSSSPKESIKVKVCNIKVFSSFHELFYQVPLDQLGFDDLTIEEALVQINRIYSSDKVNIYGIVLIEIIPIQLLNQKETTVI